MIYLNIYSILLVGMLSVTACEIDFFEKLIKNFSGSHALAWELNEGRACVQCLWADRPRRWRVVNAFPRRRVGTRKKTPTPIGVERE